LGNRIIIIEDEVLIALDIEQAVADAGCEVAGCARTIPEALDFLQNQDYDGAVVDANLNGDSARPVMEYLDRNQTPYIVVSGYTRDQLEFLSDETLLIGKPFSMGELTSSIRGRLRAPVA